MLLLENIDEVNFAQRGTFKMEKKKNRIIMPTGDAVNQSELLFLEKRF